VANKPSFKITKRHYDMIIDQGYKNLPMECGGFVGGKDMTISALLPTFNQFLEDKTKTFAVTPDDIMRAHQFFSKHGLEYYGIYHTHPKGVAEPSDQDLRHIQEFMFIISYRDMKRPDFAAYIVTSTTDYSRVPLEIIQEVSVRDIHAPESSDQPYEDQDQVGDMIDEQSRLNSQLSQYLEGDAIHYPKFKKSKFLDGDDGYSTIA
jgi:proteasome lid subunit RPN8/RPN11